jgi:hypothetical protein
MTKRLLLGDICCGFSLRLLVPEVVINHALGGG